MNPHAAAKAAVLLGFLSILGCDRRTPPPPPPPQAEALALDPWSFHFVGGLLVITGELADPTEVTLKGTTLNERHTLPFGPVRWELLRPPPGEVAELRTGDGVLLAAFDFDKPAPPRTRSVPAPTAPVKPVPAPAAPAKPAPVPAVPAKPVPAPAAPAKPAPVPAVPAKHVPAPAVPAKPAPRSSRSPVLVSPAVPPPSVRRPAPAQSATPPPSTRPVPPAPQPRAVTETTPLSRALPVPVPAPATPLGWPGAGEGGNVLRGPGGGRRICMTFDGGSSAEVAVEVLDALKARGIRTTIFLTGEFIRRYPDLVRRMDRDGHELGNHTLDHPHFAPGMRRDPKWTRERFQRELLDADRELYHLLGRPFDPYWRAPYGEQTSELRKWAEELGYRHVGWSEGADTLDWATIRERRLYRTGNAILDRLRTRMEKRDGDGLIVLMHLGSGRPVGDRPAQVLGPFLDRAMQDGWHFVRVGDYVAGLGKPRWEPSRRVALLR